MSIASRITSMEQHIGNAYDKLDELGVDLTNVDKNLDNIAELLDGVYEDYPKIEENDVTEPSINNTKAGKMEIDLKGNTEQTTYTGINKLPNRITSQTINGLTIVRNEDGSLKFNGTSTGGTNIQLVYNLTLQAGSYTMSLYGRTFGIGIYSYVNDELQTNAFISASSEATIQSITFTLNSDTTYNQIRLYVPGNTTLNNVTVYPLINQGTAVATYEPYTNRSKS